MCGIWLEWLAICSPLYTGSTPNPGGIQSGKPQIRIFPLYVLPPSFSQCSNIQDNNTTCICIFLVVRRSSSKPYFVVGKVTHRCASKLFFKVRKSQINNFLSSFRNRNSAYFLGVPVCKSQIRKFYRKKGFEKRITLN
jgi:hypothetical protein